MINGKNKDNEPIAFDPKADFKPFMRVKTKDGIMHIIVDNSISGICGVDKDNQYLAFGKYGIEMLGSITDNHTIVEIYDAPLLTCHMLRFDKVGELLWARSEVSVKTLNELAELKKTIDTAQKRITEIESEMNHG